jgi:hypothetical protein
MFPFAQFLGQAQTLIRLRRINPRTIQCIPVAKIFTFLELEQI